MNGTNAKNQSVVSSKVARRRIGPPTPLAAFDADALRDHPLVVAALREAQKALEAVQVRNARNISRAYEAAVLDVHNRSPARVRMI